MKKLLIIAVAVIGLWWYGSNHTEDASQRNMDSQVSQQQVAAEEDSENTIVTAGLRKLSLLGTWYAKKVESDGILAEIPDAEIPMAIRFKAGGQGTCAAGQDTADISWSEQGDTVTVTILLGSEEDNVMIPLRYDAGSLLWETDESTIYFLK